MGICEDGSVRYAAVYAIGKNGRAIFGQLQLAGAGHHIVIICNGGPFGCAAVHGIGKDGKSAHG